MPGMGKAANRQRRGLSKHRVKELVSWNVKKFCDLGNRIVARGGAVDSVITRITRRLNNFRDLVSLGFTLGAKGRLCSTSVLSETWSVKKEYMIR